MKKVLVVLVALVLVASLSYAAECCACKSLKDASIAKVCGSRLCNGVCNAALGWTEIFFRPGKVVAEGGNPIVGFFRGLGNALVRTSVGVVEIATFWVPGDSVATIDSCPLCAYK